FIRVHPQFKFHRLLTTTVPDSEKKRAPAKISIFYPFLPSFTPILHSFFALFLSVYHSFISFGTEHA
ncbi:MAG: hypothetical protein LBC38_00255, partial [Oscillospiraceae bacterium]|nr:hypothetical protein [Oscillospiraceae bacterium]